MMHVYKWLETPEIKKLREGSLSDLLYKEFFRDPMRPVYFSSSCFLSPADGTILYAGVYKPDEEVLSVKGTKLSAKKLLQDDSYDKTSIIIGIFMCALDVHINRVPLSGMLRFRKAESIQATNRTMIGVEKDILLKLGVNPKNLLYAATNERVINEFVSPYYGKYFVVQIADTDVKVISHFVDNGSFVQQGDRFSFVRWGSQVDLIIPVREECVYVLHTKPYLHVEGGKDKLLSFSFKED